MKTYQEFIDFLRATGKEVILTLGTTNKDISLDTWERNLKCFDSLDRNMSNCKISFTLGK